MSKLKKALEKAKAERDLNVQPFAAHVPLSAPVPPAQEQVLTPVPVEEKGPDKKSARAETLSVAYSKTRVQPIDPRVLKRNKIFSLFHENRIGNHLKTLGTQILNTLEQMGRNSLLITSANPGEGKTFMAINLGVSIAREMDHTVLIVDADLRQHDKSHRNFSHDFFGINSGRGLSDYLTHSAEIEDLLLNPGIEKLTILPAGRPIANCAEYLGSPRMEALIVEMLERYAQDRIVIFDSPALLSFPDPLVLARAIGAVLLVVEAERTTPGDLKRCKELLKDCTIIGTVFNKAK
jgi:non-specific protein-tyrosine kinase